MDYVAGPRQRHGLRLSRVVSTGRRSCRRPVRTRARGAGRDLYWRGGDVRHDRPPLRASPSAASTSTTTTRRRSDTPDGHVAVEVQYDGGWHFFDPTYGQFWTDSSGKVLSRQRRPRRQRLGAEERRRLHERLRGRGLRQRRLVHHRSDDDDRYRATKLTGSRRRVTIPSRSGRRDDPSTGSGSASATQRSRTAVAGPHLLPPLARRRDTEGSGSRAASLAKTSSHPRLEAAEPGRLGSGEADLVAAVEDRIRARARAAHGGERACPFRPARSDSRLASRARTRPGQE